MNLYLRLLLLLLRIWRLPRRGVLDESRGVLCAHAYVKGLFLKKGAKVSNTEAVAAAGYTQAPPPLPEELRLWAELGNAKKQRTAEN